jgi:hypothetical protein
MAKVRTSRKLVPFLCERSPQAFQDLSGRERRFIAWIGERWLFPGSSTHKKYPGYLGLAHEKIKKLETKFSMKQGSFIATNDKLHLFDVTNYSKDRHYARGFRPTGWFISALKEYAENCPHHTILENEKGRKVPPLRQAVHPKTKSGNDAKFKAPGLRTFIPINVKNLIKAKSYYDRAWESWHTSFTIPKPENRVERYLQGFLLRLIDHPKQLENHIYDRWNRTCILIDRAFIEGSPQGEIEQGYNEIESGRVYGDGVHLQNTARELRTLALAGSYDFDLVAAHHTFLYHLALKQGRGFSYLKAYVDNRTVYREAIAKETDNSIQTVKQILTAAIYGADLKPGPWHSHHILLKEYGMTREQADILREHPFFQNLVADCQEASKVIVDSTRRNRKGQIVNLMGKAFLEKCRTKPGQIIKESAHILQGLEAIILQAIAKEYSEDVLCLLHDGWVLDGNWDHHEMEELAFSVTRIPIKIESKFLTIST